MSRSRKGEPDKKPVSILLETPLYEGLRRIAAAEHRTMAGELRQIIEARIDHYDRAQADRAAA